MLYINNIKYSINNLVGLLNVLNKIYDKKVNINIIKLKYLFLDNSLLADAVVRKVNDRKKRVLKVIRKALNMAKKAYLDHNLYKQILKVHNPHNNIGINKNILIINKHNAIINNLHNKYLIGIRLQGNGRLTKRLTASRSILKYKNIGKLKDIISSFQKISGVMLKGLTNSNIQYLNINSNNRNGSFGIKS
jgi:ribosomal VAR1-like protein